MKIWLRNDEFFEVRPTINPLVNVCFVLICSQSFGLRETFTIESAPQYLLGELFLSQYIFVSKFLSEDKHAFYVVVL